MEQNNTSASTNSAQAPVTFCTHCGAALNAEQEICTKCGCPTPFAKKKAVAASESSVKQKTGFTKGDALLYLSTIILVVVMMLIPGWFFYRNDRISSEVNASANISGVDVNGSVSSDIARQKHAANLFGFMENNSSSAGFIVLSMLVYALFLGEIICILVEFVKEKPIKIVHPILSAATLICLLIASWVGKRDFVIGNLFNVNYSGNASASYSGAQVSGSANASLYYKIFAGYGPLYYIAFLLLIFLIIQAIVRASDKHFFKP